MTKFIINKINIEKSDKDIQTGISYELNEGFNLISGQNEAGKSSLMQFIKEGLFRPVESDTGKIFFSVDNQNFRADIKNSNKKAERCKLYADDGSLTDYEILEKFINQKYFEQGFTINLDNLMSLKYDKDISLINVIKDPSGDKLNSFLQSITSTITDCIGDKGKPKKPINDITAKISELNSKINELSSKEDEYNSCILTIKQYQQEFQNLNNKENYINFLINQKENDKKINEINAQIQDKNLQFNQKLFDAKEEYADLIKTIGKYSSKQETINKNNQKFETLNSKLNECKQLLFNNFGISLNENDFINFEINYEKINQIKTLLDEINIKNSDIKGYEKNIEDVQETLLKLNNDYNFIKNNVQNIEKSDIKQLFNIIDDGIKQLKSIDYDINEAQKEQNNSSNLAVIRKIFLYILSIVSIGITAFFLNINQIKYAGVFIAIFAITVILICLDMFKKPLNDSVSRKISLKNNIINELCAKVTTFYPEINKLEGSFLISKLEEIREQLKTTNENLTKNEEDRGFYQSKINNTQEKISVIKTEIEQFKNTIKNLISDNSFSDGKTYIESINLIKDAKDILINKADFEKENAEAHESIENITNKFNQFLKDKYINISLYADLQENFDTLIKYNENNNNIKNDIDKLNINLDNIKNSQSDTEIEKEFSDITVNSDLVYLLDDTKSKKCEIQKQIHDFEVKKSTLEKVESIIDLKNELNITISKYRSLIEELVTARAITNLTSIAKNNFDKTQPDLVNAQKYLELLTNGKYSKINLELQEIKNENETIIKKWDNLSRGTKEQLYLALRLGYASNYTNKDNKRPSLPLIIDDAFVNFDPERTQSAIKCLMEFSKTNQVLFFTCHSEVIQKHLNSLSYSENVNIINL